MWSKNENLISTKIFLNRCLFIFWAYRALIPRPNTVCSRTASLSIYRRLCVDATLCRLSCIVDDAHTDVPNENYEFSCRIIKRWTFVSRNEISLIFFFFFFLLLLHVHILFYVHPISLDDIFQSIPNGNVENSIKVSLLPIELSSFCHSELIRAAHTHTVHTPRTNRDVKWRIVPQL